MKLHRSQWPHLVENSLKRTAGDWNITNKEEKISEYFPDSPASSTTDSAPSKKSPASKPSPPPSAEVTTGARRGRKPRSVKQVVSKQPKEGDSDWKPTTLSGEIRKTVIFLLYVYVFRDTYLTYYAILLCMCQTKRSCPVKSRIPRNTSLKKNVKKFPFLEECIRKMEASMVNKKRLKRCNITHILINL